MARDEAMDLVKKHVSKKNVIYHMLAVEAVMRSMAKYLGEDTAEWSLVGLLHDLDYEKTEATPEKHGLLTEETLRGLVPEKLTKAIKSHNSKNTGALPETRMEKALIACDAISGLLVACALVMPSKKLQDVKAETVAKKFKDKDFARGADRERILMCEEMGIPRERFLELALSGLKESASEIGL